MADPAPAQIEAAARAVRDAIFPFIAGASDELIDAAARAALTAAAQVQPVGISSDGHLCTMCGITHDRPAPEADERAGAFLAAAAWIERLYPAGLVNRETVLADLREWAERATRGVAPSGHPYPARRSQPAPRTVSAEQVREAVSEVNRGEWSEDETAYQVEFLAALGLTVEES